MKTTKHTPGQKYPVGHKYTPIGRKYPRECEVIDYHVTYNIAGAVVKERYVTVHIVAGQKVIDYDVVQTTIDRAEIAKARGEL